MAENEEEKQPIATSHQEVRITIIRKIRRQKQPNDNYQTEGVITNKNYGKRKIIRKRNYRQGY